MSLDRRVARTRRLLAAAILDLAQDKDLDAITITDITERADVSRVTFYDHYRDRDDLLIAALEDTLDEIASAARLPTDAGRSADEPPESVLTLFRHVHARIGLYRRMLGPQGSARFAHTMRARVTEAVGCDLTMPSVLSGVPSDVFVDYLAGALIGVVQGYVHADPTPAPDDTAHAVWAVYRSSWPKE